MRYITNWPGLFLCNEIVNLHGGEMDLGSMPGAGAEKAISFPAVERG